MLKFNTPTILLAILLACKLAIISPALASESYNDDDDDDIGDDISPSAITYDNITALSPETEEEEDLYQRCVMILGEDCGGEIFDLIFRNETVIKTGNADIELVSKNCCGKLVNMGRDCHEQLVNVIAQTPEFSSNSSATVPRSSQVWELCSLSSY